MVLRHATSGGLSLNMYSKLVSHVESRGGGWETFELLNLAVGFWISETAPILSIEQTSI